MTFTPERMDQIRTLVERGTSREEIADMIGVTLGSLQVTCSRAGISLRKPPAAEPAPGKGAASRDDVSPADDGLDIPGFLRRAAP